LTPLPPTSTPNARPFWLRFAASAAEPLVEPVLLIESPRPDVNSAQYLSVTMLPASA
jgi:hypothetical protein